MGLLFTPAAGNHPLRSAHPSWPPTNPVTSFLFPTHRRIASSPASRVAEEETEEETEPLEAPRFWAVTVLMGTRLRSLEEEEEIGGGGGHGDGVPDGDRGGGGDGRELGRKRGKGLHEPYDDGDVVGDAVEGDGDGAVGLEEVDGADVVVGEGGGLGLEGGEGGGEGDKVLAEIGSPVVPSGRVVFGEREKESENSLEREREFGVQRRFNNKNTMNSKRKLSIDFSDPLECTHFIKKLDDFGDEPGNVWTPGSKQQSEAVERNPDLEVFLCCISIRSLVCYSLVSVSIGYAWKYEMEGA
ncbi:hypothetical protein TIFTF001_041839 [Ficus carica]|uniref:Uncharacterized protein n=1 Tax=Ficus carica TaxID=3494 RepID=A0AA87ZJB8_FICCA|nr:hypothetical protein TIFTF001_041839 [Ficus carica]